MKRISNHPEDKSIKVAHARVGKIASMYGTVDSDPTNIKRRTNNTSTTTTTTTTKTNVTTKMITSNVPKTVATKKPTHQSNVNSMKPSPVTNTNRSRNVPVSKPIAKTSNVTTNVQRKNVNDTRAVEKKEDNDKKAGALVVQNVNKYIDNFQQVPFQCDASRIRKYEQNYPAIDKRASNTPKSEESTMEKLVKYLTTPYSSVEEKARSLYIWITQNIEYDVDGLYSGNAHYTSESSWKTRKAVCSGYSDLLKKMCEYCNIECVSISGCAKGAGYEVGASVSSNHAWSAIKTEDGQYRLIESTWGSGIVGSNSSSKWGSAFERRFVDRYFFMSPYEFISEHYPDDPKWQLLPQTVSKQEFEKRAAIKGKGFECGLSCISHPYGLYTLTDSNVCEMVLKVFPGTESLINLCEEKEKSAIWDAVNVKYSENKDTIYAKICFPKKGVRYTVTVFVGVKGSKLEWGLEQKFIVSSSAKVDDRGFPTMYSDFSAMHLSLISPNFGKLTKNTTYTLELETNGPLDLMINGTSSGTTMHSHKGGGNCKCSFTSGNEPSVTIFGKVDPNSRNYKGLLVYKVA